MNPPDRLEQAARLLADLYRPGPRPSSLPPELSPRNEQEAYQLQRLVARRLGLEPVGWKVAMNQPDRGTAAPILGGHLYRSPAQVPCVIGDRLGVEPEVAFTLKRDFLPDGDGARCTREQLVDAIDAAYAAIEIVVSRFESHDGALPIDRLADNISNGGLVLSAPCRDWRGLDLRTIAMRLLIVSGASRSEHAGGGHPLGDPLSALLWLINDRTAAGRSIRAGEVVTTGSYAGLHYAAPAAQVSVEFSGLGTVRLEVS
jgi:2-keto-4-pentenoate hydratase